MKQEMSRQRKWQLRHKEAGLCIKCSKKLSTKTHCTFHAKKESRRQLIKYYTRKKVDKVKQ